MTELMTKPQELTKREWTLLEQALNIACENGFVHQEILQSELENLTDKINAHRRAIVNAGPHRKWAGA